MIKYCLTPFIIDFWLITTFYWNFLLHFKQILSFSWLCNWFYVIPPGTSQVGFAEFNNTADNRANIGGTIIGAPIVGQ